MLKGLSLFAKRFASFSDSYIVIGGHIIPLPAGDEASSLSAILLDESHYSYLHGGSIIIQGIRVAKPESLKQQEQLCEGIEMYYKDTKKYPGNPGRQSQA